MAVMALGILAGCSSVSNAAKPTTRLVASSKNSEQAWISTYTLKPKKNELSVAYVFVFKGDKVTTYQMPLAAKLSDFKGLTNKQVIAKAKSLRETHSKELIKHEKSVVNNLTDEQKQWAAQQVDFKDAKKAVNNWKPQQPSAVKYNVKKASDSNKEKIKIIGQGYEYENFDKTSTLEDLVNNSVIDSWKDTKQSESDNELDFNFKLMKPIQTKDWSGYEISEASNALSVGTYLIQPGSHKVAIDK